MMITIGLPSVILLGVAVVALIIAIIGYPRKHQGLFRIDRVSFHDGTVVFYPMKRTVFGWKLFEIEKGIRAYQTLDGARAALEGYLSTELEFEISETHTIREYG